MRASRATYMPSECRYLLNVCLSPALPAPPPEKVADRHAPSTAPWHSMRTLRDARELIWPCTLGLPVIDGELVKELHDTFGDRAGYARADLSPADFDDRHDVFETRCEEGFVGRVHFID